MRKSMTHYQLSLPGPTEYDPEVLAELGRPILPHYGVLWLETYLEILSLLKRIYRTQNRVYILPGSGSCGLDAVFTSLGAKRGLILNNGTFGTRIATIASRHLAEMKVIEKQPGEGFEISEVERELSSGRYDLLAVVHGETSTGMVNRLEELAELCRKRETLFIVDAISTLAGMPLDVDRLGIDFCVSASQKALGAPPGLAMVSVSERGFTAMPPEDQIHGWYLNLRTWAWYEKEWGDWHPYPITLPVSLFLALKKAMELVLAEGLEQAWERHRKVSEELQEALQKLGIALFLAAKEHRSYTVTAALLPEGLQSDDLQRFLREQYGILIAGGVGPLRKRIFRVGHMGYSAQSWLVNRVIAAIGRFLR
jgi:alanine-glyoxylate transaminase/serine-glyoxylate transaminase/serine-pyruvate transaminase